MTILRSFWIRLAARRRAEHSLSIGAGTVLAFGILRPGRKSDVMAKFEAINSLPGDTIAIDERGFARVLGRKPELVVDNTK